MAIAPNLKFIIIGASAAGLAAAVALRESGHDVLVLEKDPELGGSAEIPTGGVRLPPNGCKVLFDWGLKDEIKAHAILGAGFNVYKYEGKDSGRDHIGTHLWDPELISEARGEFLQMRHRNLLQILYDAALRKPAPKNPNGDSSIPTMDIQFNAEVVDADLDLASVTLRSGVVHCGDVIIGADGATGFMRERFIHEEVDPGHDELTGLAVYSAIIPKNVAVADSELGQLYTNPQMVTFYVGPNRGAQAFVAGEDEDVVFWLYTPDGPQDGTWSQHAEGDIKEVLGLCDPVIERLAALAGPAICIPIKNYYDLDSWVSDSGKAVLIGEAAHPFPTVSLHTYSVAIEDGAFIGKMFSRTRNPRRISEFLDAFEEERKPRTLHIDIAEKNYITSMALPDGPMRASQEASMRANHAAGRNVMDSGGLNLQEMWEDMRTLFGYDPADAADDWWMKWGRLRGYADATKEGD